MLKLKEDVTANNMALLNQIQQNGLLNDGGGGNNVVNATQLLDRWMRVFRFASDDFWCQCCRYSPYRHSKVQMNAKKDEEPRFYADLAAIELNMNTIALDQTNVSYVYLELPDEDRNEGEKQNNRAVFVRYKLLKIKKNYAAKYSREHRMIYIPCLIGNPHDNNEAHPAQDKST